MLLDLIRSTCFINRIHLITIIDTGTTHYFIFVDCVKRLNLIGSPMGGGMIIDTLVNGSVTTYSVCLNFPLMIYGKYFGINLVYLTLNRLNVILGMNLLEFNCMYINCYSKAMLFLEFVEEKDPLFILAIKMKEFLKDEAQVFAMFSSL